MKSSCETKFLCNSESSLDCDYHKSIIISPIRGCIYARYNRDDSCTYCNNIKLIKKEVIEILNMIQANEMFEQGDKNEPKCITKN